MSDEFGAFLRSRRARLRPEDVGFAAGRTRRVPGLRREEVAALASVSVDYISRLEQGRIWPSDAVLHSLARALRLDLAERAHLFALACRTTAADHSKSHDEVRPGLLRLLAAVEPLPAYVSGPSLDLLAWNPIASILFGGLEQRLPSERNIARLIFLDPEIEELLGPPSASGRTSSPRSGSRRRAAGPIPVSQPSSASSPSARLHFVHCGRSTPSSRRRTGARPSIIRRSARSTSTGSGSPCRVRAARR